jgi:hypothetical protein
MLTVIWGSGAMQIIDLMTEQHSHDYHYLSSNVMGSLLLQYFQTAGEMHSPGMGIHIASNHVILATSLSPPFVLRHLNPDSLLVTHSIPAQCLKAKVAGRCNGMLLW